jgi:EF-hand domain pair
LNIAHKMACQHGDTASSVSRSHAVDIGEFRTLLLHMFAVSNFWCHFNNADNWDESGGDVGSGDLNFKSFRLAVRTFNTAHANEEVSDEQISDIFNVIDSNQSGSIGFFEICNFCCKFIDSAHEITRKGSTMGRSTKDIKSMKGIAEDTDLMRHVSVKSVGEKINFDGMSPEERTHHSMHFLFNHIEGQREMALLAAQNETLNSIRRQFHTVDSLVTNPLCAGYLLQFVDNDDENGTLIRFISAVYAFKESFTEDLNIWTTGWRDTDTMVKIEDYNSVEQYLITTAYWPSMSDHLTITAHANNIYQTYLGSMNAISTTKEIMQRTSKRLQLIHLYGPHIFDEACMDPLKTAKKGVLSRFLKSNIAKTLIMEISSCENLEAINAADLDQIVASPSLSPSMDTDTTISSSSDQQPPPSIPLLSPHTTDSQELSRLLGCIMVTPTPYTSLLKFIRDNDETLIPKFYCIRLIYIFMEHTQQNDLQAASEVAWLIYKHFLIQWTPFELVGLAPADKKAVLFEFAAPTIHTFTSIRKHCENYILLAVRVFIKTEAYHSLFGATVDTSMVNHHIKVNENGGERDSVEEKTTETTPPVVVVLQENGPEEGLGGRMEQRRREKQGQDLDQGQDQEFEQENVQEIRQEFEQVEPQASDETAVPFVQFPGWTSYIDEATGYEYFLNDETGESKWAEHS